jgi:divalent metal cation (Fe/Co/Zn/Cd) transporter
MAESGQLPIASEAPCSSSYAGAIERVQWFTIVWMSAEVAVSLFAAISARSIALAAFGADSAIELLSAATVLWRFRTRRQHAERIATKITSWLLVALVVYIATSSLSALILRRRAEVSYLGMIVLFAAALIMPWLGKQKRALAAAAKSTALRADATQSSVCAYLAWIALAGLLLNAFAHIWWADALAALCLIPFIVKEAKEAFEGRTCQCG